MKFNFEDIYKHIGYLFFGLASEKGILSNADLLKLTDHVEKTWRPLVEGDPVLQKHLVDCIHAGIRYAIENSMSADHALSSFRDFFQIHSLAFSKKLKEKIFNSASLLLNEFPGSEPHELIKSEIEDLMGLKSLTV